MTCDNCGAPAQGRLCKDCELIEFNEDHHGTPSDDSPDWRDWKGGREEGDDDE